MRIGDLFRDLGFSEGEGRVYAAILAHKSPTLQSIHEDTGIERRNVYDIVNKLISKGLATYYVENKKKIYHITHPNKILAYLNEQEEEVENSKRLVGAQLGDLTRMYESSKEEIHAELYRGNEGVKTLMEEMLDYQDHYFIGGNLGVVKFIGELFWTKWNKKREEKKIRWHDIITWHSFVRANDSKRLMKMKYCEYKFLPKEFWSPHVIFIYGDKVANVLWREQSFAFQIQNESIAKSYLDYFNYLWKSLPKPSP
jgi:DNA-binding transcriptional regulator GbsR (MarR family)